MKKYLIIGLGNIGAKYQNTRHNIGFKILDELAKQANAPFTMERLAFYTHYKLKGRQVHLIKPTTFMNLSGKAFKYWVNQLKIPVENTLTLVDDLAIPFGTIRIKPKGSHAGHNGLRNIIDEMGTSQYPRLRFGIGNQFSRGKQVNYVLGDWKPNEEEELPFLIDRSINAITDFVLTDIANVMNTHNG